MSTRQSSSADQLQTCYHCGDRCNNKKITLADKYFCCEGCKMVYELLHENELCTYYDLNRQPGLAQRIEFRADKFAFLEDESISAKLIHFRDDQQTQVSFYLPQMHCSSCLWLLENSHRINAGIVSARVDFSRKEIFIVFNQEQTSLRKVAETLTAMGYEPHISLHDISGDKSVVKSDRSRIYKIGIAGFCFSNIMVLSLPEYFSIGGYLEKEIGAALKFIIVGLSLPVLLYCASEFFIAAVKGIRNKFLNIDLPIALAIAITFGRSVYELITRTGSGYLDSMTGIVFFMLVGRLLQSRTYNAISFDRDYTSFFPVAVNVLRDGIFSPVPVSKVVINDVIQVHSNELIPADAILSKGAASIDYSFVTGESVPIEVNVGSIVYAGGKQMGGNLELVVVKEVSQSYLTHLWNKDVFRERPQRPSVIHGLSKYFTFIVLLVAGVAALVWGVQQEYKLMWNALTTILIVACPCALLLSSTFTNGNILRILSKNKLYLRHPDVIERIADVNQIVFDKTGTITQNKLPQVSYEGRPLLASERRLVAMMLGQSMHPLSRAVYRHLGIQVSGSVNCKIITGKGVEGWIDDKHIVIGAASLVKAPESSAGAQKGSVVYIKIDEEIIGCFSIRNNYRTGLTAIIHQLKARYRLSVLSGDNDSELDYLRSVFGSDSPILFQQQPEDKFDYVRHLQTRENACVMMIGDGLNDAGALKQSDVGIAVTEDNNNFTPACDGILDASQFPLLNSFIKFARSGRHIMMASFVLSIVYNLIGMYYAVQGILSPLIAAILMPCSSVSIILLTYGLSEWTAKRNGLR